MRKMNWYAPQSWTKSLTLGGGSKFFSHGGFYLYPIEFIANLSQGAQMLLIGAEFMAQAFDMCIHCAGIAAVVTFPHGG